MTVPTLPELEAQAKTLVFPKLNDSVALALGDEIYAEARARDLKVALGVDLGGRQMFRVSMPGTSADYLTWVERKFNAVRRFGRSSLELELILREDPDFANSRALDPAQYVLAGGALPLVANGVTIGAAGVAGLASHEDHSLVAECISRVLAGL